MKKRYTEEQIIGFLREADAGLARSRSYAGSTASASQAITPGRRSSAA